MFNGSFDRCKLEDIENGICKKAETSFCPFNLKGKWMNSECMYSDPSPKITYWLKTWEKPVAKDD